MHISIVIVNYRTPLLVKGCLESLRAARMRQPFDVMIVDGGSGDDSAVILDELCRKQEFQAWVKFLPLPTNGGFGWANNQAILRLLQSEAAPDLIHVLNPDTVVEENAVSALAEFMARNPEVGAVGSQLVDCDESAGGSAFAFPTIKSEFGRGAQTGIINKILKIPGASFPTVDGPIEADWVTGASVMFRSSALREVGLFDEGFFLYHEEVELMWRLRKAGWSIWHAPASKVMHVGGASTGLGPGGGSRLPKLPDYWYNSHRRLFVLRYGYARAFCAALAWTVGNIFRRLRRLIGLSRDRRPIAHELLDHVRLAFRFSRHDAVPEAPHWNSPPNATPAWMNPK